MVNVTALLVEPLFTLPKSQFAGVTSQRDALPVPVTVKTYGFSLLSSLSTVTVADLNPMLDGVNRIVKVWGVPFNTGDVGRAPLTVKSDEPPMDTVGVPVSARLPVPELVMVYTRSLFVLAVTLP